MSGLWTDPIALKLKFRRAEVSNMTKSVDTYQRYLTKLSLYTLSEAIEDTLGGAPSTCRLRRERTIAGSISRQVCCGTTTGAVYRGAQSVLVRSHSRAGSRTNMVQISPFT